MTHNAAEIFTMQLARAAAKQANGFLRARHLQKADRDDIIAAAMLWCWENRDNYSLTTTLETWFMNAVRHAYQSMQRKELASYEESLEGLATGPDPTFNTVAAEQAALVLVEALPPIYKEIAAHTMEGYTHREIVKKGYPHDIVKDTHKRIKQLRRLIPDESFGDWLTNNSRTEVPLNFDDIDASKNFSKIDKQLSAQLDFPPKHNDKDCPVCWRCKWFEGYLPGSKVSVRLKIGNTEVNEAVKNVEARKIEIAQQVRDA
jgi:hypothetical protein